MQTFLPFADYYKSALHLDPKRLGKQRVECLQILNSLQNGTGWAHHPAVKMWKGYEFSLIRYTHEICDRWIRLGYNDSVQAQLKSFNFPDGPDPEWLCGPIHASHRSNLLRKDFSYYGNFGWLEKPDMTYFWPV